jgi:AcrR family transcriptional regulator/DNA-binding MarR family transcriptional regulator
MASPRVRSVSGVARVGVPAGVVVRRSRRPGVLDAPGLADGGASREQIAAIQRSRLLAAALCEMDERGYAATTVAHITSRSRVSRRTFYELFANREECLAAVLEQAVATVERDLAEADLGGCSWRERIRRGLWVILSFFDREPALARVCIVQALGAGSRVLERREAILGRLAAVVDEGRAQSPEGAGCNELTAEGVVGAALAILYARLLRHDPEPLQSLIGELTGMIVLPYLGRATARREQLRPAPAISPQCTTRASHDAAQADGDPLVGVPMRLTYRTARVLEGAGEYPGASNRQLADYAEIHDPGQISKLLTRLQRLGLIENQTDKARVKGEPNAWTLTAKGQQITHSITTHTTIGERAA